MVRSTEITALDAPTDRVDGAAGGPGETAPALDRSAYAAALRMAQQRREANHAIRRKERRLPIPVQNV